MVYNLIGNFFEVEEFKKRFTKKPFSHRIDNTLLRFETINLEILLSF